MKFYIFFQERFLLFSHVATIPMASFRVKKSLLTNMLSKRVLYILSIFSLLWKSTESNLLRLCGKKALQTWLITNAIFNIVTSLVEAWKPACVETSQYIKSHETVPTLQINYCIVEHVKKDNLCSYERKATYTGGQLPSPLQRVVTVTDRLSYLLTSLG